MSDGPEDPRLTAEAPANVRCDECTQLISVHEPMVMLADGRARETSRDAEYALPLSARYYHQDCYRTLSQSR